MLAAASLTNVLGELSPTWEKRTGIGIKLSFASSSVLARQIEAGGKADVFVSADQEWMDYLQSRELLDEPSRRDLVGNRLVLIAPADSKVDLTIAPGFRLFEALGKGGGCPRATRTRCLPAATRVPRSLRSVSGMTWRIVWCARTTCAAR